MDRKVKFKLGSLECALENFPGNGKDYGGPGIDEMGGWSSFSLARIVALRGWIALFAALLCHHLSLSCIL